MALRATKGDEDAPSWGGRPRPRIGALAGPTAAGRRARGASSTECPMALRATKGDENGRELR